MYFIEYRAGIYVCIFGQPEFRLESLDTQWLINLSTQYSPHIMYMLRPICEYILKSMHFCILHAYFIESWINNRRHH
jgi:hypothetical protein